MSLSALRPAPSTSRSALAVAALLALAAAPLSRAAGPTAKERLDIVEQDLRDAQQHVVELQERLARIEKENADLRAALALDKPGQRVTPADLASRISSLETDVRIVSENQHENERRMESIADRVDAVFRQVQSLTMTAAPPPVPAGSGLTTPEAQAAPTEDVAPRDGSAPPATASGGAPAGGRPLVDPEEVYQAARADFGRGSYDLAESGFQEFIDEHPDSDLADNAMYWVGECRFARQDYDRAVEAFDTVVARWPNADKAPDAAYKRGLALLELNRTAEGIVQLQRVKDRYPDAPAGRLARGKLQSLGLL